MNAIVRNARAGGLRALTGPLLGALFGAGFILYVGGTRVLRPTEYEWLMKLDWRIHFLGWHFFRNEPWHWPPGRIENYFNALDGTSIGFTDSIPLMAFLLKPFSALLPVPFQYLGLWILGCFILQGVFGALITRIWTPNVWLQSAGAALFVVVPSLLIRVGHPALCAHFLVLWTLWLYLRGGPASIWQYIAVGLCSGLVHPYLAVMVLMVLAATVVRDRSLRCAAAFAGAGSAVLIAWWAAGLLLVSNVSNLASEGLGNYSMNLVGAITPSEWSTMLPEIPTATPGQAYDGFHYLGVGMIALMAVAMASVASRWRALPWRFLAPLALVCLLAAAYALSPRVTLGSKVLFDYSTPALERWAVFRASGRFFWPAEYLIVSCTIGAVVSTLRPSAAAVALAAGLALQLLDLRGAHADRRTTARSETFHTWVNDLPSPVWHEILPRYDHIVIAPPRLCAEEPIGFEAPALLAGQYGLTLNSGEVARFDELKRRQYCRRLADEFLSGAVDDRSLYLVADEYATALRASSQKPLVCGSIDRAYVCVTADSYRAWATSVALQ
jgi:hypothetical protein